MKTLRLKTEYENIRLTIQHQKLGQLTFDSDINNSAEYPFFYENGFSHLFEIVKPIEYKGITNKKKK